MSLLGKQSGHKLFVRLSKVSALEHARLNQVLLYLVRGTYFGVNLFLQYLQKSRNSPKFVPVKYSENQKFVMMSAKSWLLQENNWFSTLVYH